MPAGQQVNEVTANLVPLGYAQFTSGFNAAQALTVPDNAVVCVVQVNGGGIRWRDDGADPTTAAGIFLSGYETGSVPRETLQYNGALSDFRFIEDATAGTPNTVDVSFYRYA